MRAVVTSACVRVRVINVLAAVELAVRVNVAVSGVPTRQELGVHVVGPLREQRPRACSANRMDRAERRESNVMSKEKEIDFKISI